MPQCLWGFKYSFIAVCEATTLVTEVPLRGINSLLIAETLTHQAVHIFAPSKKRIVDKDSFNGQNEMIN